MRHGGAGGPVAGPELCRGDQRRGWPMVGDGCSVMRGGSRVDRRRMGMRRRMLVSGVRNGQRRRKAKGDGDDCRCQNPGKVVLKAHDSKYSTGRCGPGGLFANCD